MKKYLGMTLLTFVLAFEAVADANPVNVDGVT